MTATACTGRGLPWQFESESAIQPSQGAARDEGLGRPARYSHRVGTPGLVGQTQHRAVGPRSWRSDSQSPTPPRARCGRGGSTQSERTPRKRQHSQGSLPHRHRSPAIKVHTTAIKQSRAFHLTQDVDGKSWGDVEHRSSHNKTERGPVWLCVRSVTCVSVANGAPTSGLAVTIPRTHV